MHRRLRIVAASVALMILSGSSRAEIATFYGHENGRNTASGDRFDPEGFCADYPNHSCTCAAPRRFAFNTFLRVTWAGRSVVCRVNDRGPTARTGADIDLSVSGARVLGMIDAGRVHVRIERVEQME